MRHNLYNNHFQKLFGFILLCAILSGSFLIGDAQTNLQAKETPDRDKHYAQMFRLGRGADFDQLLTRTTAATEIESIERWLDENNAAFFRRFDAAFQDEVATLVQQKKKDAAESRIAPKKNVAPKSKSVRSPRAAFDAGATEDVFFRNASFHRRGPSLFEQESAESFDVRRAPEDFPITKAETDDGFQLSAATEKKTKTVGGITYTQGATAETRVIMSEGGNIGSEYKAVEYVEAVNNADRTSLRTETTVGWRVSVASCPDADGVSAGNGTITSAVKKTIKTPQTIGVVTRDITTQMTIKGFVNDAAELTHFDMEGGATETVSDTNERSGSA